MKATYQANPNLKLEAECSGVKGVFKFLSAADTVLGVRKCGNCESPNLSYKYSTPTGYEYFSIKCNDCRHEFKFGIRKEDQELFPKGWEPPYERDSESQDDGGDNYEQDRPQRREQREPARAGNGRGFQPSAGDDVDF